MRERVRRPTRYDLRSRRVAVNSTYPKPRQGVPHRAEAFVLCPAVLQPLPFRDGHGSYLSVSIAPLTRHALPTPILQASSRCSTSCLSRQPHKPKLLPFAASVAPWAFSPPQTRLPQLHRECPALRGLTTTFRSTVCRHRDCAHPRLRSSPSSGRPAAPATPSPKGYTKIKACCAVVGRAVSHPQNAYCAHLRGQYQQPHPVGKPRVP